jgi:trigger factor
VFSRKPFLFVIKQGIIENNLRSIKMAQEQETTTAKNTVTIEQSGPCKKKVIIQIPEETVKNVVDKEYDNLRREVVLPGFRKGRAPRRLLEKRFGKETTEQIKLKLLAEASDTAIKDNKLDVLRDPDIKFDKIDMPQSGPLKFDFEVEVRPEFELPSLEGIPVNKTKLAVTEGQIDREVEQLQKWSGIWTPRDGAAESGDQIIADVILKSEDVEEEEKLNNIEVFVRHSGFVGAIPVENLDELLVGAKSGEVKKATVEVPKTYFREDYRGKKVNVQITVKEIKWLKPAELNEEFLKKLGAANEKELREKVRDMLQSHLEQQAKDEMTSQIYKYMLDNTKLDLPLDIVADQATTLLQRQYVNLLQKGLSREQVDEHMEQLRAGSEQQAGEQLKTFFIMDRIADKLGIDVTDEEINGYIAQAAIQRGQRPERLREEMVRDGSLAQFKLQVRENKCISKLLESAKITEVEPEQEAPKAKKPAKKLEEKAPASKQKPAKKEGEKPAKTEEKPAKKLKTAPKKKTSR